MCYLRRRLGSRREGRLVGERITDLQGCFRDRKRHLCADLLFPTVYLFGDYRWNATRAGYQVNETHGGGVGRGPVL